jgi:hypothetical protein
MQIVSLLYLTKNITEFNYKSIAGSALLTLGFLFLYNLFSVKKIYFTEKRILFWAIIINPCLFNIFLGIATISGEYPQMERLHFASVLAVTVSVIVGFTMLIISLFKKKEIKF